ncbi:MAG: hypothetical protein ACFFD4_04040 [Candidatus Odinarchaeota archaeon]
MSSRLFVKINEELLDRVDETTGDSDWTADVVRSALIRLAANGKRKTVRNIRQDYSLLVAKALELSNQTECQFRTVRLEVTPDERDMINQHFEYVARRIKADWHNWQLSRKREHRKKKRQVYVALAILLHLNRENLAKK